MFALLCFMAVVYNLVGLTFYSFADQTREKLEEKYSTKNINIKEEEISMFFSPIKFMVFYILFYKLLSYLEDMPNKIREIDSRILEIETNEDLFDKQKYKEKIEKLNKKKEKLIAKNEELLNIFIVKDKIMLKDVRKMLKGIKND